MVEENYHGTAWYRREIEPPEIDDGERAFLHFYGVDEQAWVWVNGEFVGEHTLGASGWDEPFLLEITDAWSPDSINQITIKVDNTAFAGGIWQPIALRLFR